MKIYYISSSKFPSRKANSVHVIKMINALSNFTKTKNILFASSNQFFSKEKKRKIIDSYNANIDHSSLVLIFYPFNRMIELFIFFRFLLYFLFDFDKPKLIISRNLLASYFYTFFSNNLMYETHFPEKGLRLYLQKIILNKKNVKKIVITEALKNYFIKEFNLSSLLAKKIVVMPDGADKINIEKNSIESAFSKKHYDFFKKNYNNYKNIIGYFGHLYQGRGFKLIEKLAKKNSNTLFVIYGGMENDISNLKKRNIAKNLIFMGYVENKMTPYLMTNMDILLMPYEKNVYLSKNSTNTANFMSPMKMFEYMSSGKPIISSDHKVLKEILIDKYNCLMVDNDIENWNKSISKILSNSQFAIFLGKNAKKNLEEKYTWLGRSENIIKFYTNNEF